MLETARTLSSDELNALPHWQARLLIWLSNAGGTLPRGTIRKRCKLRPEYDAVLLATEQLLKLGYIRIYTDFAGTIGKGQRAGRPPEMFQLLVDLPKPVQSAANG